VLGLGLAAQTDPEKGVRGQVIVQDAQRLFEKLMTAAVGLRVSHVYQSHSRHTVSDAVLEKTS
jgi:hypothetical protein